ncbi:MAG: hypothetical protein ACI9E5_000071 [Candidatus Omnitrophota bacterium]|jgi:uncharacterized protein
MLNRYVSQIAQELSLHEDQVSSTIELLDGGGTVPFISRYRKEATGSLDEVQIMNIRDRVTQLREMDKRRGAILKSIDDQGKLSEELKVKIKNAETMAVLEDLYLPYKPKRRTKSTVAKEKGLEPLAAKIYAQTGVDIEREAIEFVSAELGVESTEDALAGARDIMAEWINEDSFIREKLRDLFHDEAIINSKVMRNKEEEGAKFRDYFAYSELAKKAPSHRILAMRRGEKESILMVRIYPDEKQAFIILENYFVKGNGADSRQVRFAAQDGFKRLLMPSLETEIRLDLKKHADAEAIDIFKQNFRELLMASPVGQKRVMAIDPGLRTGCKIVVLDAQGKLICNDTMYLVGSEHQRMDAEDTIRGLVKKYDVEFIAIGNGTAGRETEVFIRSLKLAKSIHIVLVNESGASIYSASEVARDEFPNHDVTVRGSVSIGRRLMDPLAELVKIDAKSIGVGQYQHDVDQRLLKKSLDDVVESCVNQVGVEINTASKQLLTYVSGLGPTRAQAIVDYRNEHGAFESRSELSEVKGLGGKAVEQAAGFLRIYNAKNPLDASAVHIERYALVDQMAKDLECGVEDLIGNWERVKQIDADKYVTADIGLPTLEDIKEELAKPGRDPREEFQAFSFKDGVETMDDLTIGMKLPGIVTNVTAFGAFVDIGVHQDGLVHISELSDKYVKDANEVVKVQQKLSVTVLEVDKQRGRIALSAKS